MNSYVVYQQGDLFHITQLEEWQALNKQYKLKSAVIDSARTVFVSEDLVKHLIPNMSFQVQKFLRELWREGECL